MKDFAAIDFETANNERTSVCSVGVVIVRNGEIVDSFYSLIQPEPNYYNYWCTQVHGLTRRDTEEAPVFPVVWKQIEPLIEGLPLPRTISSIQSQNYVAITSPITITPLPMPKPAPGLQERSFSYQLFHATLLYSYKNKRNKKKILIMIIL